MLHAILRSIIIKYNLYLIIFYNSKKAKPAFISFGTQCHDNHSLKMHVFALKLLLTLFTLHSFRVVEVMYFYMYLLCF